MSFKVTKELALDYHKNPKAGKISVVTSKSFKGKNDLSLAYTPGVAYPCEEIKNNPNDAFLYTSKSWY